MKQKCSKCGKEKNQHKLLPIMLQTRAGENNAPRILLCIECHSEYCSIINAQLAILYKKVKDWFNG